MFLRSLRRGVCATLPPPGRLDLSFLECPSRVPLVESLRAFAYRPLLEPLWLIKRTFQPSLVRRKRKWGFLARLRDKDGRKILNRRRHKGRARLSM